ncbi:putative 2OG-Fe(II) oxygenase [Novosphingobium resinovorum]
MWGTILRPGGEVGPHIHAPNWLSGVYYPEFEGEDGAFAIGLLPEELGGGGTPVTYPPRAGRMILFPSYMWHATLPFGGDKERISFAFDLVPKGIGRAHKLP